MKGLAYAAGLTGLVIAASAVMALAQEQGAPGETRMTGSLVTSFLSQYVYRGYELSSRSLVIQPSLTLSHKGFSLNL